jgi:beta-xylosidase
MRIIYRELISLIGVALLSSFAVADPAIPAGAIPAGLGVNIHFTHAKPDQLKLLADTGISWIRMDFQWAGIERKIGVYDFSAYDGLMKDLDSCHIHPLFILDYGNPIYGKDSPSSDEARSAFAKWAAASVTHFANRGVVWEMWNEPNIGFWKPKPDVEAYAKLSLATGKAIHAAEPDATFIGPGTSTVDVRFCQACFKAGCLNDWSAVSVHPYRQGGPELAAADYKKLSDAIAKYAPANKTIPIISSEWGYSVTWKHFTPELQGDYLARQWLVNQWQHIPISIYYDWHDDGTSPTDPEHHFGIVDNNYQPKPAYLSAKTLITQLKGYTFDQRIETKKLDDYVMQFRNGNQLRLAVWTAGKQSSTLRIAAAGGEYQVVSETGQELPRLQTVGGQLEITATGSPQYLIPVEIR